MGIMCLSCVHVSCLCVCYACIVMVIILVLCCHDVDVGTIDMLISSHAHMYL